MINGSMNFIPFLAPFSPLLTPSLVVCLPLDKQFLLPLVQVCFALNKTEYQQACRLYEP